MKRYLLQLQSDPTSDSDVPDALFIFFIFVFFTLFAANLTVTIRYRIYENRSSLFITSSLILLDLVRMATSLAILLFPDKFFNSELLIRLAHDLASFLFDCVTIALIFQFIQTYEILANHEQAFENMRTQFYVRIEYTIISVYVALLIFDIVSLAVDGAYHF